MNAKHRLSKIDVVGACKGVVCFVLLFFHSQVQALNGGDLRIIPDNGWEAFEVISEGDTVPVGSSHSMQGNFDGLGAWLVEPNKLRVLLNHETEDASISEVDLDLSKLKNAISNMIQYGNTGEEKFVVSARQAYNRWSGDLGSTWTATTDTTNTNFLRFCSGQAYAPNTFGQNRGFLDEIYITGEEGFKNFNANRLFALDSKNRDLYQLSDAVGSATGGGNGGMPRDSFENAALLDTGEKYHIALLLSPDGGSETMKLYIGEKGKKSDGAESNSFLARNGLAYGSWYYLIGSLPDNTGSTNSGSFGISSSGALSSTKLEDIDTSPSKPTRVVLGDQTSGVFTLDFLLDFPEGGSFNSKKSTFTVKKIAAHITGKLKLGNADNVDWTAPTTLGKTSYDDGLIFVNEDNGSGEIWQINPDGTNKVRIGSTVKGATESSGILDISKFVAYVPGSILITNNQQGKASSGFSSMTVLIHPDAATTGPKSPTPAPVAPVTPAPVTPAPVVPSEWEEITNDNFENGWGNFAKGGNNVKLYTGKHAPQGSNAIRIRGKYGIESSLTHSTEVKVDEYISLQVKISFKMVGMDKGERFEMQVSRDGNTFTLVKYWVRGKLFSNQKVYTSVVQVSKKGASAMKVRFTCDANENNDKVFIDDIKFEGKKS